MSDQPQVRCPQCGELEDDFDGFGMLAHTKPAYEKGCGYCSHPSRDGGVCGICGDVEVVEFEGTLNGEPCTGIAFGEMAEKLRDNSPESVLATYPEPLRMIDCGDLNLSEHGARKTMDDIACERGDMAAAIIADHATKVEASRGDDSRLLFECSILEEEIIWDPDKHDWDGPIVDVLARIANEAIHERDQLHNEMRDMASLQEDCPTGECGMGDREAEELWCGYCRVQAMLERAIDNATKSASETFKHLLGCYIQGSGDMDNFDCPHGPNAAGKTASDLNVPAIVGMGTVDPEGEES